MDRQIDVWIVLLLYVHGWIDRYMDSFIAKCTQMDGQVYKYRQMYGQFNAIHGWIDRCIKIDGCMDSCIAVHRWMDRCIKIDRCMDSSMLYMDGQIDV